MVPLAASSKPDRGDPRHWRAPARDRLAVCASTEVGGSLTGEIRPGVNSGFVKETFRDGNRRACTKREIEGVARSAVEFLDATF